MVIYTFLASTICNSLDKAFYDKIAVETQNQGTFKLFKTQTSFAKRKHMKSVLCRLWLSVLSDHTLG
jgi:hypothetical protein